MDEQRPIEWRAPPQFSVSLKTLTTMEWAVQIGIHSTPVHLYLLIRKDEVTNTLRRRYLAGMITDQQLEAFLDETAQSLEPGSMFPYTEAWAAILWIVHDSESKFAQEFIEYLCELNSAELVTVRYVAREIRKRRDKSHA